LAPKIPGKLKAPAFKKKGPFKPKGIPERKIKLKVKKKGASLKKLPQRNKLLREIL